MKSTTLGAVSAVLLALLAACNPGTSGVFASIESETKIVANGDLPVKATVTSMAEDNTTQFTVGNSNGNAKLYSRKIGTPLGQWSADESLTDAVIAVAGQGDGNIYRIRAATTGNVLEWKNSSTWSTVVLNTADTPVGLVPVVGTDGHTVAKVVVVTKKSDNSYQNVYLVGGSATAAGPVDLASGSTLSTPVTSAAVNGSGYLLVNRSFLWTTGADLASPQVVSTSGVSEYAAVLNVSGVDAAVDGIYLATRRIGTSGGSLVVGSLSGTTFTTTTSIATNAKDSSSTLLDFTTLIVPPASTKHLLAGTYSSGFGELDKTTWTALPSSATVDFNNYSVSALPKAPVLFFFVSPTPSGTGTLYLGTYSLGLWSQSTDKSWSN